MYDKLYDLHITKTINTLADYLFIQDALMNKLANSTSPYLLQHANNPVNWYPWGAEALEKAKAENKLILVSIG